MKIEKQGLLQHCLLGNMLSLNLNMLFKISLISALIMISPHVTQINTAKAIQAQHCPSIKESPVPLQKVAKDTYARKGINEVFTKSNLAAIATISFVIGKDTVAVIDTGGSFCDGARFLQAIRTITKKPISHVINTHTHPDHILGNAAFTSEKPIFIGHKNLKRAMAERGNIYIENLKRIMGEDQLKGTKIIPPTEMVKTTKTINLGEKELNLKAYGTAHTDHDLTVYDPKTKIIWTGDLLFHEHTPVVDGSLLGWQKQLGELEEIPAKFVIPGHGGPLLKWPEALVPQKKYLEKLTEDLRKIIENGGTMLEAQTKAGASEKPNWLLFEEFNPRNASAAFAELEWE